MTSKPYELYGSQMQIVKVFRDNARAELARQGKTQADVARDTSLSIKQVYSLVNHSQTKRLDFSYAMALADYLCVSVYALTGAESSGAEKELKFKKVVYQQRSAMEKICHDHDALLKKFDEELKLL